jgi:hypothetical protein
MLLSRLQHLLATSAASVRFLLAQWNVPLLGCYAWFEAIAWTPCADMGREPPQLLTLVPGPCVEAHPQPAQTTGPQQARGEVPPASPVLHSGGRAVKQEAAAYAWLGSPADPLQSQYGSSSQLPGSFGAGPSRSPQIGSVSWGSQPSQFAVPLSPRLATQASQAEQHHSLLGRPPAAEAGAQQPSTTSAGAVAVGSRQSYGMIAAASLGSGDAVSFAYRIGAAQVRLRAETPRAGTGADAQPPGPRAATGSIALERIVAVQQHMSGALDAQPVQGAGQREDQAAAGGLPSILEGVQGRGGFMWTPHSMGIVQSLGLPRRICLPLRLHAR